MTSQKPHNKKKKWHLDDNPIESGGVSAIASGVAHSLSSDLGGGAVNALWDQLLGTDEYAHKDNHGDLAEGEEFVLPKGKKATHEEEEEYVDVAAGIEYHHEFKRLENQSERRETQEIQMQIQEIIKELKRLAASSSELQVQFKEVIVEQRIEKPGKYHVSFFEWVLAVVRSARIRVEDSGSWLAMFQSKKKQKGYWQMFKKHGTTFGLSNERVVATQTG